jgi:serine/threonine protein kinase/Tfp pilus assembly protein PilF
MDPERWKQLDSLLQSVLERRPENRDAFLHEICAGDEALERELRSLVHLEGDAGRVLDRPAIAVAASSLARDGNQSSLEGVDTLIGRSISHYRIIEKIGAGGMGVVYKAEDERLHRVVAVKFLSDESARAPDALTRFRREARTASALNHPNICTIHDIGEQDGRAFIVMEYLEGASLKDRLADHGGLPLDTVLTLGIEIADALDAAHHAGIVHRDIKPANIFISSRGHAKILDFGLAKMHGPRVHDSDASTLTGTVTQGGLILGTAAYMAPEQARGEAIDHRADIWAFGLVLYEMAKGLRPVASVRLHLDASPALEPIVSKCLEADRDARYQHAAAIRDDLQRVKRDRDAAQGIGTPNPAAVARRSSLIAAAAVMTIVVAVSAYLYSSYSRTPRLTDTDTIVLADFDNKTGDPVFDDTLRQGLSVELQQSPFLSLISDRQVQQQLALMEQPQGARLTFDVAQQICERTASAVVIEGSIASLGSQYVLGLRARNCRSGALLDEEQIQAARREEVLNSLSEAARKLRTRLGESQATIEKHSTPLAEATTSSLEALKAYSTGTRLVNSSANFPDAVPFMQRAVEIDPRFAMAHASLGIVSSTLGETVLAARSATRAWQLRDRVSDRERFFIDFIYERQVTGNLEAAYQTLESWLRTYPRGETPANALSLLGGLSTHGTGRFERAIETSLKQIAIDPGFGLSYENLAQSYFLLNRFDEAEPVLQRAADRKLENPILFMIRYNIAVLTRDQGQVDRTATLAKGKPTVGHTVAYAEALALARSGRLQLASQSSTRAIDLARQERQSETAASYQAARAVWEAVCGNSAKAKSDAIAALALSNGRDVEYTSGLALALSGDSSQSKMLADDLDTRFPEDTFAKFTYVPVLRALTALADGKPADSVERLQVSLPYELAVTGLNFNHFYLGGLHSAYVRGEAFAAERQYPEAAAEFQKLLDHRGIVGTDPIGALAHLQLGRTFLLSGDKIHAKAAYQDFFILWKDADGDTPILLQAKTEYAQLQ